MAFDASRSLTIAAATMLPAASKVIPTTRATGSVSVPSHVDDVTGDSPSGPAPG